VLVRQRQERLLDRRESSHEARRHGAIRRCKRFRVQRERAVRAAPDVARELVEQQPERKRRSRRLYPLVELVTASGLDRASESRAALGVELG
jgi:hypothetical protein